MPSTEDFAYPSTIDYPIGQKLLVELNSGELEEVTVIANERNRAGELLIVGIEYQDGYRQPIPLQALERALVEVAS